MNMIAIITKKRQGKALTAAELAYVVEGYTHQRIPDYQVAALLMAITIRGLTLAETIALTTLLQASGQSYEFGSEQAHYVDKHSTGGIGDKVTLILGPLSAALGLKMLKMSGASLGYTGGTADKLRAIPGFRVELTDAAIKSQLATVGTVLIAQSQAIAPADKALYALRDVTATVDSLPLIAASIMAKKLASGAQHILLDIKCGNGAFMKTYAQARKLGELMVELGERAGRNVHGEITQMDEPLGRAVGNRLEVQEALAFLTDYTSAAPDLQTLILSSATRLLRMARPHLSEAAARTQVINALTSGAALTKFADIVKAQGGDWAALANTTSAWWRAPHKHVVLATKRGYVKIASALTFGEAHMALGGLRTALGATIDDVAGVYLHKKTGDPVAPGEVLCEIQSSKPISAATISLVTGAFRYTSRPSHRKIILDTF